jgi:DNA replication initiation complex subunit (GINS family)
MAESTLEFVKRHLDLEAQSDTLHQLPLDFYSRVSQYTQRLKRSVGSGTSEVTARLVSRQTVMIESMARQLLSIRARKAGGSGDSLLQLLPEERYVCSAQQTFQRRLDSLVEALTDGKPSFIEFANRAEFERNTVVRFIKQTGEIVGGDFRRYGPFEENDVASLPAANAAVLIEDGDAVEVRPRQ